MDLLSNPGVELIAPQTGEVHILPYSQEDDVSAVAKREPWGFGKKFGTTVRKVTKVATNVAKNAI